MSFAATLALVAAFEMERDRREAAEEPRASRFDWIWRAIAAAALTSLVAGLATGPFSTYHFQTYAKYGLFANIAATPIIAFIVTPALMIAVPAAAFGLEAWPLRVAEWGAEQILLIANWAQAQPGAVGAVAQFSPIWLLVCTFGLCGLCLAKGFARIPGAIVITLSVAGAALAPKPIAVVSRDAAMAGKSPGGFVRSQGNPESFELQRLSQSIGAAPDAPTKTLSEMALPVPGGRMAKLNGDTFLSIADPNATLKNACLPNAAFVLVAQRATSDACKQSLFLDGKQLKESGGLSLYMSNESLHIETVQERRGKRPWTQTPR